MDTTNNFKINHPDSYKIPESEVIKRVLAGERELYEILIRRNNQKLYRVIRSYIRETADVEDLMQNTYLKAYEKLYQFQYTSAFSTWLIKIGINEALARLKEKNKVYQLYGPNDAIETNLLLQMQDPNQLNPEKQMISLEARRLLEGLIDTLELKYRTVYILKEVEGMKIDEISLCLNLSISNVKVRLHRARSVLKNKLCELTHDNEIFEFGSTRCDALTDQVMKLIS